MSFIFNYTESNTNDYINTCRATWILLVIRIFIYKKSTTPRLVSRLNQILSKSSIDSGRGRTCNLLIRSQTRYPLRHRAL